MRALQLLVALVLAVPAAAFPPVKLVLSPQVAQCATPTLAQCKSPAYRLTACGKIQLARARVDPEATCNQLFLKAADAASPTLPVREILLPSTVSSVAGVGAPHALALGDCQPDAPGRTCARVQPVSYNGLFAHGGNTLAFASTLKAAAFGPASNATSEAATQRFLQALVGAFYVATPPDDPYRVRTCSEYVYEKYFDYTKFEEKAAALAFDPRGVFHAAFASPELRSSIGTRSLNGIPLSQLDGTPFAAQIAFPTNQQKNAFFALPLAAEPPPDVTEDTAPALVVPCLGRDRVFIDTIWLEDRDLYATLALDPRHDENFGWHKEASDVLAGAGYLDEELYALDALKDKLAALLDKRAFYQKAYHDMLIYMAMIRVGSQSVEDGIPNDPYEKVEDPWGAMAWAIAAHEQGVDIANAGQQVAGVTIASNSTAFASSSAPTPETVQAYLATTFAQDVCDAGGGVYHDFFTEVSWQLSKLDAQIEAVLHEAQDAGCLDVDSVSPCDWSPRLFAQRVTDLYVGDREADFGRCVQETHGNIEQIRARHFHIGSNATAPIYNADGINCTNPQYVGGPRAGQALLWSDSPSAFEEYGKCITAWIKANVQELIAHQGSPFGPDGKVIVGKGTSDSLSLGSDVLGATLGYEARFGVNGFDVIGDAADPTQFYSEKLNHSISGKVIASGTLFGKSVPLVDASMKATMQEVDVDFIVNGQELYADPPEQVFQGSLAPVMDGRSLPQTFVQGSTVVPVLGIPITVKGKIQGEIGVTYTATSIRNPDPANHLNEQLVASFTPYTSVDAFASASVDLAVIDVGVKGKVTIISLSLPYAAGTHVYVPTGMVDPAIDVSGDASMKLGMLGGNLRAYGEIDFGLFSESAEVPIFSWGGLHYEKKLWADDYSVSVEPLYIVQRDGFPGF